MSATDAVLEQLLRSSAQFSDAQVAETVELLLAHGVEHGASDVHMQPQGRTLAVRYRIDGALHSMHKLPLSALPNIIGHLKQLAGLHDDERRVPQEGQFDAEVQGRIVHVIINTMPVVGGEHVVLHLTSDGGAVLPLEAHGLWGHGLAAVRSALAHTRGLIVVAGAKQAATNELLLSLSAVLNRPSVSIMSIEQRVLHTVHGITQTELRGPSADALQAALRHDPNIIMIDNLPDRATATLAAQAAGAGHLMLVGLHAANASKALLHLAAAGVEPFLLSSILALAVAEQSVPRLCEQCRIRHELSAEERAALEQTFGIATAGARVRVHELERQALAADLGVGLPLSSTVHGVTHVWRANPDGCGMCHRCGTNGLTMLTEVISPSEGLRHVIAKASNETSLQAAAVSDGAVPLALDGLIKALRGLTTIEAIAPIV